jgi:uncharacterized protein YndB with AHSA1/START domain
MDRTTEPPPPAALHTPGLNATRGSAMPGTKGKTVSDRELLITRVFDAPRNLVFEAWTRPEHLAKWWGPVDYPADSISADVRVGGRFRHSLRSVEDCSLLWHGGEFRQIVPPEKLVFTFAWDGEEETVITVTFAEEGKKTRMTFHQAPFSSLSNRDGHIDGWNSAFDRFEVCLAS